MADAQGFDPPLLSQRERDEEPELDQLRHREVFVELLPQRIVRDLGVPDNRARVGQRDLLAGAELLGVGKRQQVVVFLFGESLPSALDGALDASVVALDGLRHVHPAELLDGVIEDAVTERQVPRL